MSSYTEKISDKINSFESNKVFFANDFLDITSYETARKTLNRMVNERKIKRVIDGFYYNPRYLSLIHI